MATRTTNQGSGERRSYLLRLHRPVEQPSVWRVSLQDVRSGEWRYFADLDQLFTFLTVTGQPENAAGEEEEARQ